MEVRLDGQAAFETVDPSGPFLPGFVTGRVRSAAPPQAPLELALAIDGTVRATGRSFRSGPDALAFAFLVPESAFRPGPNAVQVFALGPGN